MEKVRGTKSQLQHSGKIKQKYEPSDDSSDPSVDSTDPTFDYSETSAGSSHLSSDTSVQSSSDSQPTETSSATQQTSEVSESKLSESEYSSVETSKEEEPRRFKLQNQVRNKKALNTGECSTKTTNVDQLMVDILKNIDQQSDSFVESCDSCGILHEDGLKSNKSASEIPCEDVCTPAVESSFEGGKPDGGSGQSFSHGSAEIGRANLTRKPLPRWHLKRPDYKPSTSDQDLTDSAPLNHAGGNIKTSVDQFADNIKTSVDQFADNIKTSVDQVADNVKTSVDQVGDNIKTSTDEVEKNINNSSVRKRPSGRKRPSKLPASQSVHESDLAPPSLWMLVLYIIILATSVLIVVVCFKLYSSYVSSNDDSSFEKFSTHVREIKQHFPSQNRKLWKIFVASTRRILKKETSTYPAVVLMASGWKHSSIALCIARNISSAFDSSLGLSPNSALIDFKDYRQLTPAGQKLQLDNALNSAFGGDKRRAIVLENLQFLDPLAAVLFYNYCDNDYAPFKDVLIIMTLYFDEENENIDNTEGVENYLERIWNKGLEIDQVKPLLSRMANNIVIVQGEGPEMLDNRCP